MIKCFLGLLQSNVYVLSDNGEAVIIDAGAPVTPISDYVREKKLRVKYLILTHGHFDHIAYIKDYMDAFCDAEVVFHEEEQRVLLEPDANLSGFIGGREISYDLCHKGVRDNDKLSVGSLEITVIHTPGHTPGGICLLLEKEGIMFTGDTLFAGGIGRTDFKYGNYRELVSSLEGLLALDGETVFYSGHGTESKIKYEKNH